MNVIITDDAEGKDILFGLDDVKSEVIVDNMQRPTSGRFEIAALANENLPFGDVQDVRFVYIKADGDFDLKFNGGAEVLNVKKASTTIGTFAKFEAECDVTAVNVTNPSATAVLKGIWCVYGDPS
jgi:hypothetical protein